ncbi:MAG: DNA-3-methyladenine glycosylase [Gemmatimonadales bacterium]
MTAALPDDFFSRDAGTVARELLGTELVTEVGGHLVRSIIVETEAYLGLDDPASHAYRGRCHAQNEGIYSPPGHWYVYRSYGIHWCANLVTGAPASGAAVLLRSVRIVDGIDIAALRRGSPPPAGLSNGPGKLCQALGIDRGLDGQPMRTSWARIYPTATPVAEVTVTPRIGITRAVDWPLRFLTGPVAQNKRGDR